MIVTLLVYVLAKIGASVFAGAVLIEVVTGINFWLSVPAVIVATAVYTISGGLTVSLPLQHRTEIAPCLISAR